MQRVAAEQKRIQLENAKRKKKTTITLIIVGSVSLLAILGTVIYLKNKK
jgi:flagellar basal body-associated protein FliL